MSEEFTIVRPFAYYVQEKELVYTPEPRDGAYNMMLQVWVDREKGEIPANMSDCGKTRTRGRRLTTTRITGNPPGLDRKWEGSDID
jgi:hypothetical protein